VSVSYPRVPSDRRESKRKGRSETRHDEENSTTRSLFLARALGSPSSQGLTGRDGF